MEQDNKITIYLDADDTVLASSEAMIKIINRKYNINPQKTIKDMHDWGYKSIYKDITCKDVTDLYESDEFFETVKFKQGFFDFYKKHCHDYKFIFVTKGTALNIQKKEAYLRRRLGDDFEYIGMEFKIGPDGEHIYNYNKSTISMKKGIQIDDRTDALRDTSATIKILLKNGVDQYWNGDYENINNLYAVNTWDEIVQIIEFCDKEHYMFKKN